jgi:NTP pyrophosphatase (non-canonical NTP hydrolase)
MVTKLLKPGTAVLENLTPTACDLIHTAMGVCTEAGELLDAVKKATIYRKPLDIHNVIEELGDLEFYMEALRQTTKITREETLLANLNKLSKGDKARYKDGYSDAAAIERVDKK